MLLYYKWVKQGTEKLKNLPQVTPLVIGRAGVERQEADFRVCAHHHWALLLLHGRRL